MQLTDIQNTIIDHLENIRDDKGKRAFLTIDIWNDQPEEIIKKAIRLPAAFVTLGDGRFTGNAAISTDLYDCHIGWDVFVIFENYRNRADSARTGVSYIDMVIAELVNIRIGNVPLEPASFALVAAIGGKSAYAINIQLEHRMGKL